MPAAEGDLVARQPSAPASTQLSCPAQALPVFQRPSLQNNKCRGALDRPPEPFIGVAGGETRWRTVTLGASIKRLRAVATPNRLLLLYCAGMYFPSFTVSKIRARSSRPLRSFS